MAVDEMVEEGTLVTVVDSSFGWGACKSGMVGHVVGLNNSVYMLDVPTVGRWGCARKDFVIKDDRTLQSSSLTKFLSKKRDRLQANIDRFDRYLAEESDEECIRIVKKDKRKAKRSLGCLTTPDTDVFNMVKKQVEYIRFTDEHMTIKTKEIVIPYYIEDIDKTIQVPMGKFRVSCNFKHSSTNFEPCESNVSADSRFHPHIDRGGSACWGTYGNSIANSYKSMDVCGLVSTILQFLNSCYARGWYEPIYSFMRPDLIAQYGDMCTRCEHMDCSCEDWCENCDRSTGECSCDRCDNCGLLVLDCACMNCPENGEQLSDNTFPDGSCANCPMLRQNIDSNRWQCTYNILYYDAPLESYSPPTTNTENHRYATRQGGTTITRGD